jgi:capsular exopolysaccharide synthesis family protein
MQEVVDSLNLKQHKRFQGVEDKAGFLLGMTRVEIVRDSALFRVTVMAPDQEDVATWANKIAEVYADQNLRSAVNYVRKANQEMQRQVTEMQEQYARQQQKYSSTLAATDSYFPENQKEILDKRIEALELKLNEVRVRESELAAQIGQMSSWSSGGGNPLSIATVAQDPSVQDLAKQYNEAERELNRLLGKFTPQHPEVQKKQRELQGLKERIAGQGEIVASAYRNQYKALRGEEANLNAELSNLKRQGLSFAEGATQSEGMATSSASMKKYIDLIYDKMRELDVAANLLSNNIRIVEPAVPPAGPIKPNKRMNIMLALICGLMLSVGSVVAQQFLDTRIRSVEDIEQGLGHSLLSMIPSSGEDTERSTVESFQTLRTALTYASQNKQRNVLLVTSAGPREGKSTVALNLAGILASGGDRVLLMDCDLRRPSLHRKLKQTEVAGRGLTHYMANRESRLEDYVTQKSPNLWLFFAGPIPPNPPELFSMKRFGELVERVGREYDWVIIDSPPCLSITDAQILASHSDLVVMVARYKSTQKPLLQRAMQLLERGGAQVAGVVLNDVNKQSSYYYDYYYANHYYYSTGIQPKRLPWLLGKRGEWKNVLKRDDGG